MGIGCGLVAFGFDDLEQPPRGIKRNSTDEPEKSPADDFHERAFAPSASDSPVWGKKLLACGAHGIFNCDKQTLKTKRTPSQTARIQRP